MTAKEQLTKLYADWFMQIREMQTAQNNHNNLMKEVQDKFNANAEEEKKLLEVIEAENKAESKTAKA